MGLTSKISATFGLSYKENYSFSPDPRTGKQSEELAPFLGPVLPQKSKSLSFQAVCYRPEAGNHVLKGLSLPLLETSVPGPRSPTLNLEFQPLASMVHFSPTKSGYKVMSSLGV